ncbi:unnamed protein product, partial [Ectocarpus fasciculatus]
PALSSPHTGSASYWDERYASSEETFDWYQDYSTLRPYIIPHLKKAADFEILVPGCGNSRLGADIYSDGFVNITNVDISSVVISQMTSMYAKYEEMEFSTMDAKHMEFIPNCCFDVIVDKALFDSMLCGDENTADVQQLVTEMWRILKPGGVYLLVSHGAPPSRLPHLSANSSNYQWSIQHHELR